jgi:hypothetical protein
MHNMSAAAAQYLGELSHTLPGMMFPLPVSFPPGYDGAGSHCVQAGQPLMLHLPHQQLLRGMRDTCLSRHCVSRACVFPTRL